MYDSKLQGYISQSFNNSGRRAAQVKSGMLFVRGSDLTQPV